MKKKMANMLADIERRVAKAVEAYWQTRKGQADKQSSSGKKDQGARSAVTGGAQMNGFVHLVRDLVIDAGIKEHFLSYNTALELPGFFRPTKEWDLLVVKNGQLVLALEAKSQVGPSFGNNFNNRTEEAIGSAVDIWTAYREGAFNTTIRPWLGYIFLLEDCRESRVPVRVKEPHFPVLPEFKDASYALRYELFCRKLVRERHYNTAAFLLSKREKGIRGQYTEPAEDLKFEIFVRSLIGHVAAYGG